MKKASKFKNLTIILLLLLSSLETFGQTACTQTLRRARTVFDEGRIQEIESLLTSCIDNGFSDEERTEAYRLLILSYIYLDETQKADDAMIALLRDNHGYSTNNDADPAELINLYNTFRHDPIFFFGFRAGGNATFINVINAFGIHNQNNTNAEYLIEPSFEVGLTFEKKFGKRITVKSDLQYLVNAFQYENSYLENEDDNTNLIDLNATETINSFGATFMGQFSFFKDKKEKDKRKLARWNPYVGLGGTARFITSSSLAFDVKNSVGASPDGSDVDLFDEDVRELFNPTVDIEIGVKRAWGLNYINFGIRGSYGLLDVTDRHYVNGPLTTFFGWAANDINTHSATVFLAILLPKYAPKKLTK